MPASRKRPGGKLEGNEISKYKYTVLPPPFFPSSLISLFFFFFFRFRFFSALVGSHILLSKQERESHLFYIYRKLRPVACLHSRV